MHRIDTPTAQKDKFGAGKNGFTRGNPQTGVQATALDDDYFDAVQEEIVGVIEGAGIALNKANRTQLLTALKKLFLQSGNNLSEIKAAGAPAIAATLSNIGALSTTGTAAAATKLATARKIGGVDFDGTKDITLPFINTTDTNIQLPGTLSALSNITTTNGHLIATNGNIACNNGNLYAGTGVASGVNVQAAKNLIAGENLSVGGRADITGDIRGGRVLSKSDVIVGEGQAGGYALISSTGNINGSQFGGWLSTRTARAFAVFSGTSGAVSGSVGVTSVTRNAVGTYTIVFSSPMPGTYAVFVGTDTANRLDIHQPSVQSKTATSFQLLTSNDGGTSYGLADLASVQIVVFSTGI
ncbi:hypothetical protein [Yersinia proxima]|uniref:hypothetical protein n=1 Tax=Yersinia proxima TaxID=2890316 RepID=UPI001D11AA12|nr:hypothetical protein [Yersinia proxima]